MEMSKLQIRAKVLSVVSQIKSLGEYNEKELKKLYSELEVIEDKETLFDIFVKEFIKMDENEYIFASCIIKDLIDTNYMQDKVFEILKSNNYSDDAKYKLVQMLRISGSSFDYNVVPQYFENPEEIIDSDTKKLLEKAVINPESMLDFLDFVAAVPAKDRNILLESLKIDYAGDMLANIIYPILYADFDDDFKLNAISILAESKSSLAIAPFNYLIETSSNEEIISECKTGLKKLKLAGANEEKEKEYFKNIIKNTELSDLFTTIPDGQGNQAILISRINKSTEKISISAVVTNDRFGIIDCFGFYEISKNEFSKILSKFYQSEGKYIVEKDYVKAQIENAINLTIKNKRTFPYEFICWNVLTKDIEYENFDTAKFVEEEIEANKTTKETILDILTKEYSFRWYIKSDENSALKNLVDKIYEEVPSIEDINTLVKSELENIFDEETKNTWKNRLTHCIYLLYNNDKKTDSEIFKSILQKEEHFNIFKSILVQRSIFNHFFMLKEAAKENILTTNIFRKKEAEKNKIDTKKVQNIIELLKKNWINE